jgi:hypothetical protein
MNNIEGCVFREFLLRDCPQATDEQLDNCQEDLVYMAMTEGFGDEGVCYRVWISRLGGVKNIVPYAEVLAAGKRRKQ